MSFESPISVATLAILDSRRSTDASTPQMACRCPKNRRPAFCLPAVLKHLEDRMPAVGRLDNLSGDKKWSTPDNWKDTATGAKRVPGVNDNVTFDKSSNAPFLRERCLYTGFNKKPRYSGRVHRRARTLQRFDSGRKGSSLRTGGWPHRKSSRLASGAGMPVRVPMGFRSCSTSAQVPAGRLNACSQGLARAGVLRWSLKAPKMGLNSTRGPRRWAK